MGSLWITEIAGRNEGAYSATFWAPVCPQTTPQFECTLNIVAPGDSFVPPVYTSINGAIIRVISFDAAGLILSARVRDLSCDHESWGAELPVVRESELADTPITLLNLPTSDRFRTTIRMYDFGVAPNEFLLSVSPLDGNEVLSRLTIPSAELRGIGGSEGIQEGIQFATISDLSLPAAPPERVRVSIRTVQPTKFWAVATVTNNDTQYVTVVSPLRVLPRAAPGGRSAAP